MYALLAKLAAFAASKLGKVLIALAIIGGIYLGITAVIDLVSERNAAVASAKEWKDKAEALDLKITQKNDEQKEKDKGFSEVDDSNLALLCLARYGYHPDTPVFPVPEKEPVIQEIVKWREREVQVPVITPQTITKDPAISTEIAQGALNNAWKAYCIATDNKDDVCKPFR